MTITSDRLAATRRALDAAWAGPDATDEITVETGVTYRVDDPVLIRIRRRGRRYDLGDDGAAIARAGRAPGWRVLMERIVAIDGFNVNRSGALFVPVVEGRDIAALAVRLADTSRNCYLAVLELGVAGT
jgi:hypothetical protein